MAGHGPASGSRYTVLGVGGESGLGALKEEALKVDSKARTLGVDSDMPDSK